MFNNIGLAELILILLVVLIIFGPKKLPQIGAAFGKTLSEFKKATNNLMSDDQKDDSDKNVTTDVEANDKKQDISH